MPQVFGTPCTSSIGSERARASQALHIRLEAVSSRLVPCKVSCLVATGLKVGGVRCVVNGFIASLAVKSVTVTSQRSYRNRDHGHSAVCVRPMFPANSLRAFEPGYCSRRNAHHDGSWNVSQTKRGTEQSFASTHAFPSHYGRRECAGGGAPFLPWQMHRSSTSQPLATALVNTLRELHAPKRWRCKISCFRFR
jgi:hypothetical protein